MRTTKADKMKKSVQVGFVKIFMMEATGLRESVRVLDIPLNGFLQALGKFHLRPVAEFASGAGDVQSSTGLAVGFGRIPEDRKSTRLNSSHRCISYAVFCL